MLKSGGDVYRNLFALMYNELLETTVYQSRSILMADYKIPPTPPQYTYPESWGTFYSFILAAPKKIKSWVAHGRIDWTHCMDSVSSFSQNTPQ